MRSLLRFGAGSMRHRDVFDVYYHLRIKGIDVGVLGSCMARGIFGDESKREEGWADVSARLKRSSRTGVASASFPGRKAIGWSFPRGR